MKRNILSICTGLFLIFVLTLIYAVNIEKPSLAAGYSNNDINVLARCVHAEARGESYEGQVAVAAVILNRVKHPSFPNTIAGVIYQPGAFASINDGQINAAWESGNTVYSACRDAMAGWDPSNGAIYYYNPAKTTNKWIYTREVVRVIGNHTFAK